MTTPHDPHDGSATDPAPLDPARDAAVRRLLAEAGGPETVPDDVAARLDDTLADLVGERTDPPTAPATGTVTDLASRRRRRVMRGVLGAAAAVVVIGLGLQFTDDVTSDDVSTLADGEPERGNDAAGSIAPEESSAQAAPEDELFADADAGADRDGDAGSSERSQADAAPNTLAEAKRRTVHEPVPVLHDRSMRDDLLRMQDRYLPSPATADYSGAQVTAPRGFACADMDLGHGIFVGARYRGETALVGFREPVGSTQVADVLRCGTDDVLRSMTLPAP
ncbi:hypothetical protein [Nocardioides sambongensis]|uniref:hypothetical protein n=1 Tax=Nocardioides sambongensis TaxID=2589074 RepID=UPI00112A40AE|nr:hypothetical protein [Nocardioides sambongensis]